MSRNSRQKCKGQQGIGGSNGNQTEEIVSMSPRNEKLPNRRPDMSIVIEYQNRHADRLRHSYVLPWLIQPNVLKEKKVLYVSYYQ